MPGRAHSVGDPPADDLGEDARRGAPECPRRPQRAGTWWPRCDACTGAPPAPASYPRVTGRAQARVLIVVLMALMVPGIQWSCRCQCQPRARTGERPGAHAGRSTGSARTTSARAMTQRPRRTKGGTAHLLRRSLIAVRESPAARTRPNWRWRGCAFCCCAPPAGGRASRLIGCRSAACGDC